MGTMFAVQRVENHTSFGDRAWQGLPYPVSPFSVSLLNLTAMRPRRAAHDIPLVHWALFPVRAGVWTAPGRQTRLKSTTASVR